MSLNTLRPAALLLAMLLATGCAELPALPTLAESPKPADDKKIVQYEQTVAAIRPIKGLSINVVPTGDYFYRVQVKNSLPIPVKLLWDDSSLVSTDNKSTRIIRIADRNRLPDNTRQPQAESPIPRGAQFSTELTGESWIKLVRAGTPLKLANPAGKAKMFLLFEIQGKDVIWQGEVSYTPKK